MTTIGIVEDDRLLNEALARMLEKKGYHPLRAYTLEEGMKLIRQKPELIILDINLPFWILTFPTGRGPGSARQPESTAGSQCCSSQPETRRKICSRLLILELMIIW